MGDTAVKAGREAGARMPDAPSAMKRACLAPDKVRTGAHHHFDAAFAPGFPRRNQAALTAREPDQGMARPCRRR